MKSTKPSGVSETNEHDAALWLQEYNRELFVHAHDIAETAWDYSTNISDHTQNMQVKFNLRNVHYLWPGGF